MENSVPAITTGEWILIGLGVAMLVLTVASVVIGWRILMKPRTYMEIDQWQVIPNSKQSTLVVAFRVSFSPVGGFRVAQIGCRLKLRGREIQLRAGARARSDLEADEPFVGEQQRQYAFESDPADVSADPDGEVEAWLHLTDGSKVRSTYRFNRLSQFLTA